MNYRGSLASCTELIEVKSKGVEPGKIFEYGGAHMAVAGRMAEVATQQSWNTLFETYVRQPLNLSSDAGYGGGTLGDRQILLEPTQNPRLGACLKLGVVVSRLRSFEHLDVGSPPEDFHLISSRPCWAYTNRCNGTPQTDRLSCQGYLRPVSLVVISSAQNTLSFIMS